MERKTDRDTKKADTIMHEFLSRHPESCVLHPLKEEATHVDPPSPLHDFVLSSPTESFQEEIDHILEQRLPPPPSTTGYELTLELMSVVNKVRRSTIPESCTTYFGPNFTDNYVKYCVEDLRMEFSEDQLDGLYRVWNRVTNWVIHAKYHYMVPRPIQLAAHHNLLIEGRQPEDPWSQTPSYPSLRCALGHAASKYLSHSHPTCYEPLVIKTGDIGSYLLRSGTNFMGDILSAKEMLNETVFSADDIERADRIKRKRDTRLKKKIQQAKRHQGR